MVLAGPLHRLRRVRLLVPHRGAHQDRLVPRAVRDRPVHVRRLRRVRRQVPGGRDRGRPGGRCATGTGARCTRTGWPASSARSGSRHCPTCGTTMWREPGRQRLGLPEVRRRAARCRARRHDCWRSCPGRVSRLPGPSSSRRRRSLLAAAATPMCTKLRVEDVGPVAGAVHPRAHHASCSRSDRRRRSRPRCSSGSPALVMRVRRYSHGVRRLTSWFIVLDARLVASSASAPRSARAVDGQRRRCRGPRAAGSPSACTGRRPS